MPRLDLSMSPIVDHSSELRNGEQSKLRVPHADQRNGFVLEVGQQPVTHAHLLHRGHGVGVAFHQPVGHLQFNLVDGFSHGATEVHHGVSVDEFAVDRRQPVVHHHVHPLSKHPELKVENSSILLRVFVIPLLGHVIGNDLEKNTMRQTPVWLRSGFRARQEQAATNQQFPTTPWFRSWELMPFTNR
ncbi:hypothetical protein EYF80_053970 [Liparis tanakae]|uniref:Uncharacterized protein n=1 Tax=Liparis tanakae TaxID=230148 RepID=A0A4Z2F4P6_9TELE|nr:hypothetical protein EYF80_053970 [Liparis tanakae]